MPSLSSELFGSTKLGSNQRSNANENDFETSGRNNEFLSLKEAINSQSTVQSNSRNEEQRQKQHHKTATSIPLGASLPKLDFKKLKKVQEFKDWYAYASKLEDSVKFLRIRVKQLEDDN